MEAEIRAEERSPSPRRRPRWRWIAAACLALLALLAAGVALSWHFSDAVLVPDRSNFSEDIAVEAVRPGSIVLQRTRETERPGIYGLDWQAGHAIAGPILGRTRDTVTRRLSAVRGYLPASRRVAIDSDVYSGDPRQALGLPFKTVAIHGELGPMPAWLVPAGGSTWAIFVHGINSTPQNGLRLLPTLHAYGLPTMLITYREDLGAPASPDGFHHMGLTEWRDLESAARFALDHGAKRLVLIGNSMGGSLVTQFMERSPLADRVRALVLDAPALDWKSILSFNATQMGLLGFAAAPVEWAVGARIDADWGSLDAISHPEDFHLPILLFHGREDELVPISTSEEFAGELPRWVTFYEVPHAGHVQSWNVGPVLYDARLTKFLQKALKTRRARPPGSGSSAE